MTETKDRDSEPDAAAARLGTPIAPSGPEGPAYGTEAAPDLNEVGRDLNEVGRPDT